MPIYEYECAKCGAVQEVLQRFTDKPLKKCPECAGKLHKLISQSSFHLKGSGWYVTDYANKKSSKPASTGKKDAKSTSTAKSEKTTTASTDKS
jgi:putative FmdB family regulatory protein